MAPLDEEPDPQCDGADVIVLGSSSDGSNSVDESHIVGFTESLLQSLSGLQRALGDMTRVVDAAAGAFGKAADAQEKGA